MSELDKLNSFITLGKHVRHECMECSESPDIECLWAEGAGHAWFCNKHFNEWKDDEWHKVNTQRNLKYGIASEKWKEPITKESAAKYYVDHPSVVVNIKKSEDILLSVKAIIRHDNRVLILGNEDLKFWDLPGGHVKDGETLEVALRREVREETGLEVIKYTQIATKVLELGNETKPVCFYLVEAEGDVKLSKEHQAYKWVTYDELENYNLGKFKKFAESTEDMKLTKGNRIYVKPGDSPPPGVQVKQGLRGGRYYESMGDSGASNEEDSNIAPSSEDEAQTQSGSGSIDVNAVNPMAELIGKVKENSLSIIHEIGLPEDHWKGMTVSLVETIEKKTEDRIPAAVYEEIADTVYMTKFAGGMSKKDMSEEYKSDIPDDINPWKVILIHELGHRTLARTCMTKWKQLNNKDKSVTLYGDEDLGEHFAESYLYYIIAPMILLKRDRKSYDFIKENCFNGREFLEEVFKGDSENNNDKRPKGSYWIDFGGEELLNTVKDSIVKGFLGIGSTTFAPTFGGEDKNKKLEKK
jgi:8-oxo-dGTP diphosphatase